MCCDDCCLLSSANNNLYVQGIEPMQGGAGSKWTLQLWQARVGMGHMEQFNAYMGLDRTNICVFASFKSP